MIDFLNWFYIVSFFIDCQYYNNFYCSNNTAAFDIKIEWPVLHLLRYYDFLLHLIRAFLLYLLLTLQLRKFWTYFINFLTFEVMLYPFRSKDQPCMKYCNFVRTGHRNF